MRACPKESEHHSNGIREFHMISGDFTGKPHCPHCGNRLLGLKATRLANVTVNFMAGSNLNTILAKSLRQIQFCQSPIEFACGICGNRFPFSPNEAIAFLKGGVMPASSPSMLDSVNAGKEGATTDWRHNLRAQYAYQLFDEMNEKLFEGKKPRFTADDMKATKGCDNDGI